LTAILRSWKFAMNWALKCRPSCPSTRYIITVLVRVLSLCVFFFKQ
jgi:hypothetical protein